MSGGGAWNTFLLYIILREQFQIEPGLNMKYTVLKLLEKKEEIVFKNSNKWLIYLTSLKLRTAIHQDTMFKVKEMSPTRRYLQHITDKGLVFTHKVLL